MGRTKNSSKENYIGIRRQLRCYTWILPLPRCWFFFIIIFIIFFIIRVLCNLNCYYPAAYHISLMGRRPKFPQKGTPQRLLSGAKARMQLLIVATVLGLELHSEQPFWNGLPRGWAEERAERQRVPRCPLQRLPQHPPWSVSTNQVQEGTSWRFLTRLCTRAEIL